ncbi:MAG: tRNA preQ1(34) S-adenosylmethionine ribosyltransferase-isomerase QueA, partial [bacterium]
DARLMVLDRPSGRVVESGPSHRVRELPGWLRAGDLLVLNATRVLPARLVGRKTTGGAAEALLLGPEEQPGEAGSVRPGAYRALLKSTGRVRVGLELRFGSEGSPEALPARVAAVHDRGEVTLLFDPACDPYSIGVAPLPPYIRRSPGTGSPPDATGLDLARYQTVYARAPGAVAAPTAGLHLTHELLEILRTRGVEVAEIVLHVGAGTFRPLDAEALARGRLHAERFELDAGTAEAIRRTRARGGRVVAVGTTTTRVLESQADGRGGVHPGAGVTELFLRPEGPPFQVVDGMLTNFHLPRSSLLLLVAALIGREPMLAAYRRAIDEGFRFYSYGDAMLILPDAEQKRRG